MNNPKTALITGATSGIGSVVAEHLVLKGYNLIILGRSAQKLQSSKDHLTRINSNVVLDTILCDLSSFRSVKNACEQIKKSHPSIHTMVLNAGLWNFKFIETTDKIEEIFQVNLLSPITIFNQLKGLIPVNEEAKVLFTCSGLHQGVINFSDIEWRKGFTGFKAYRQTKLGLIMLMRWLSNQPSNSGISFFGVHPGMVNTQLGRNAGWLSRSIFKLFGRSKEKGAQTHIFLIDKNASELQSGEYYSDKKVTKTTSYSYNMADAEKLWDLVQKYITDH